MDAHTSVGCAWTVGWPLQRLSSPQTLLSSGLHHCHGNQALPAALPVPDPEEYAVRVGWLVPVGCYHPVNHTGAPQDESHIENSSAWQAPDYKKQW